MLRSSLALALLCVPVFAQKMSVKVIDRQDQQTGYSFYVPGQANATTNYYGDSATTTASYSPPRSGGYNVTGATLGLLIPDGRIAIANCASKYAFKMDYVNRRSCRIPLVDDLQAEFKGNTVKISWPVSLDGKKFDSETYKITAIIPTGYKTPAFDATYSGSFKSESGPSVGATAVCKKIGPDSEGFYHAAGTVTFAGSPCFVAGNISVSNVAGNFLHMVVKSDNGGEIAFDGYFTDPTGTVLSGTYQVTAGPCAGDHGTGNISRM
jgi:hypothetical protein